MPANHALGDCVARIQVPVITRAEELRCTLSQSAPVAQVDITVQHHRPTPSHLILVSHPHECTKSCIALSSSRCVQIAAA